MHKGQAPENGPYSALVVSQGPEEVFTREVRQLDISRLPPGDLLIHVLWSSLNYKDALAATGRPGVAVGYPLTPGIDAAGVVEKSASAGFAPGDPVIVSGRDLGIRVPGGFGQYIRVPFSWALRPPAGLTLRECMTFGTAGITAALSIRALQVHGVSPERGKVLVTGATGGVGSFAVAILSKLGYEVVASTGKVDQVGYLISLGARETLSRLEMADTSGKALLKEKWAGVVDAVGGTILSTAIRSTMHGGSVAACGNASSPDLPLTVFPFILRGVQLLGIDSSQCPASERRELWDAIAGPWKPDRLAWMASECSLRDLNSRIDEMMQGRITGRVVINLEES